VPSVQQIFDVITQSGHRGSAKLRRFPNPTFKIAEIQNQTALITDAIIYNTSLPLCELAHAMATIIVSTAGILFLHFTIK